MKPYLIGNQWVNLDDVLVIGAPLVLGSAPSYDITGTVTLAFRSEPLTVIVGQLRYCTANYGKWLGINEAHVAWDAFIAAWKTRDTKRPDDDLPPGHHIGPLPVDANGHAIP